MVRQKADEESDADVSIEKTEEPTGCCDAATETHVTISQQGNYKVVEKCSECGNGKDMMTDVDQ